LQERRHSQLEDITAENGAWPHLFSRLRSPLGSDFVIMLRVGLHFVFEHYSTIKSDPGELRSRREERMENGVKNLKGARLFPKTISTSKNGDAC